MGNFRLIPVVLISGADVLKGVRFKNRVYVGDPLNIVRIFNDKYVDELVVLDISATSENAAINLRLLKEIAAQAFMPIAYGGGIRDMNMAESVFDQGFEKCVLNSICYDDPLIIERVARKYGSQSVSCVIDFRRSLISNRPVLYSHSGMKKEKKRILDHCLELQDRGAGELIVSSIDRDGTRQGLDIEIYRELRDKITVPLVASGGSGSLEDISHLKNEVDISAVAVGDLFTFYSKRKSVLINYPEYQNLRDLFG